VFSASGNNITPAGDLSRRSVVIRLDANTENLEQRRFNIPDLEAFLIRNRASLLVDVLTIIKAYALALEADTVHGMPVPLPSFEQWSKFVREPLIWLGLPDPVETQKREADEDKKYLRATFELLHTRFGSAEFSGVEIAHLAGGLADANGELIQALLNAGCQEPNSALKIGFWLRSNRDKVFNGQKLVAAGHYARGARWKFQPVKELN
jgi:hypothetical protein